MAVVVVVVVVGVLVFVVFVVFVVVVVVVVVFVCTVVVGIVVIVVVIVGVSFQKLPCLKTSQTQNASICLNNEIKPLRIKQTCRRCVIVEHLSMRMYHPSVD